MKVGLTDRAISGHNKTEKPSEEDRIGHRKRLRDRLLSGGPEALADYELLEFILFAGSARGDTKPLAKALIRHFGSVPAALNASPDAIRQIKGIGEVTAAYLRAVALIAKRMARITVAEAPVISTSQALHDYLFTDMAQNTRENVRILYLSSTNRLIADQLVSEGSIDEAAIYPREVVRRAFDVGAAALILVHNHPSGNAEPSKADIQITQRIAEAGQLLGIAVHDHIIVGKEGSVSFRQRGLL